MRILSIRFKNINSLAGEWQVDFTQPEYTADGIFAITGPTGAGKTTLLDVICLALYGRTPRLERINKSGNDVMTRQTGECFAEVTFSTPAGTFRCHWSQHRARKKADGELQTSKHEISDANSGQIIDNQIRTVEKRIEETTGMDFGRFTQSMMLAQGGFAAFLKASADERAPILEQITGTGIYSGISISVHERHAFERNLLQTLQSELSGLQLLSSEQESALKAEESVKAGELLQQQILLHRHRQHYEWKRQCQKLEQNLAELTAEQASWQQQHEALTPQRAQLDQANRALELAGDYSALLALRQNQQDDLQRELLAAAEEPALQSSIQTALENCQQADIARTQSDQKLLEMRPVFKQVHVLDSKVSQLRTQSDRLQTECRKREDEVAAAQQQTKTIQAAVIQGTQSLATFLLDGEISYEPLLKRLAEQFAQQQKLFETKKSVIDVLSQGRSLSQWRQHSEQLAKTLSLCDTLAQRYQECTELQEKLQSRQHQMQTIAEESSALTNKQQQCTELVAAREALTQSLKQEAVLLQTVKNLESERAQLRDGQPCPLCGSPDHPYASHTPDADIEAINRKIHDADKVLAETRAQQLQLDRQRLQLQERLKHLNEQHSDDQRLIKLISEKIGMQRQELNLSADTTLAEHRIQISKEQDAIRQTLDRIETEQQMLVSLDRSTRDAQDKLADVQKKVDSIAQQQQRLQDFQQQLDKLLEQKNAALAEYESQQQTITALVYERQQLLGDKDADELETRLESELADASGLLLAAQRNYQLAEKHLDENRQLRQTLMRQLEDRREKIRRAEMAFIELAADKGFHNEQEYLAATLPETERQRLQQTCDQLKQQGTELQALHNQITAELDNLRQQALSIESLDALQQAVDEQEKHVSQLQEALGGIRRDLSNNELARSKQQLQAEKIDAQKSELERWSALHDLIGSADGKKFRNYAQGLTFELMISHANQQLSKMTDRYLLIRDKAQPLDLNVIDHYQAGEIRSTKNLSGGESFVVSLALALGLSRMASRNVRVDSLFLDEGFGTLDEDALDTALETLASLQQEGKLIGIISHVPALKERISTQIKVSPGIGGRSILSGPGCQLR